MKNYKYIFAYILLAVLISLSFAKQSYKYEYKVSNTSSAVKSKVNPIIKFLWCDTVSMTRQDELYMSMNFIVHVRKNVVSGREYSYSAMYYNDIDLEYVVSLTIRDYTHDRAENWSLDTSTGIMTIHTMLERTYRVEFKEGYFISTRVK